MTLALLSVNVALPRFIGMHNGEAVLSGIAKEPVSTESIFVRALGLEGDGQADLAVHGGADKAVYAYPSDHWPWWTNEKHLACRAATFGENLTLSGMDETAIFIGDRFAWGDALLEVSQPRGPCYKLNMHTRRADCAQAMTLSGRCGWYFRVLREGAAPVQNATLLRVARGGDLSVREAFAAAYDRRRSPEERKSLARTPGLSPAWRVQLAGMPGT